MKGIYSHAWLQSFFKEPLPDPKTIHEGLMTHAFEVESVTQKEHDTTYELDILPNRSADCLAHYGIAKEISGITEIPLKKQYFSKKHTFTKTTNAIQTEKCSRYTVIKIENIELQETPKEIQQWLEAIGQQAINPIVDITNYLLFDIGQPAHAFDAEKVSGEFSVRQAKNEETLTLLGGEEVTLQETDLVITDKKNDKAIALAGIKGGEETKVDENTKNIYLELAAFEGASVRQTMRRTGQRSDAALRFSQNYPPELIDYTANRAKEIFEQYGTITDSTDSIQAPLERERKTGVAITEVNNLLGTTYTQKDIEQALKKLHLPYEYHNPREVFIETIKKQIGKPYQWGASVTKNAPDEFDCSSLVCYAAAQAGKSLPRMAINQYLSARPTKNPKPGDLLFTATKDENKKPRTKSILEAGCPVTPGKVNADISHVLVLIDEEHTVEAEGSSGANKVITKKRDEADIHYAAEIWDDEKRYAIKIPVERPDIRNTEDMIEEIGRILGYNTVPVHAPKKETQQPTNKELAKQLKILTILTNLGFSEIMTGHFQKKGDMQVAYPVAKDKGYLRTSLKDNMLEALTQNAYNGELLGLSEIRLMEIGSIFTKKGEKKQVVIGIRETLGRKKTKTEEIEKEIQKQLNISSGFDKEGVWEIPYDDITCEAETYEIPPTIKKIHYKPPTKYPFVLRDIALFVPKDKTPEQTKEDIREHGGEYLKKINLFDTFNKDNKTSYAFRLVFQSEKKTLDDQTINEQMKIIYKKAEEKGYQAR